MQKDHDKQVEALTNSATENKTKYDDLYRRHGEVVIDNEIQILVNKIGAKPADGAMPDIIKRVRGVFSMDEKFRPAARDTEENPIFSKDGTTPLTMKEYLEDLPTTAPHLYGESAGSGGVGGGGAPGGKKEYGGLTKEDFMKLPPSERLKIQHRDGIATRESLALGHSTKMSKGDDK